MGKSSPPLPDASLSKEEQTKALIEYVQIAEKAERHGDMCFYLHKIVQVKEGALEEEQRNFLSVAFKNVVGALRTGWRQLHEQVEKTEKKVEKMRGDGSSDQLATLDGELSLATRYQEIIKEEVLAKCREVVGLLTPRKDATCIAIPKIDNPAAAAISDIEQAVFYLKMKGDYYRYMAEVEPTVKADGSNTYGDMAIQSYNEANKVAEGLKETHPTRLGLALNRSVCYYEIQKESQTACNVAKKAFDDAIQKLDTLNDDTYKDSTLIMQLLRDNLTLWTSENQDNVEEQED